MLPGMTDSLALHPETKVNPKNAALQRWTCCVQIVVRANAFVPGAQPGRQDVLAETQPGADVPEPGVKRQIASRRTNDLPSWL